jgi:hypothetical protein
MFFYYFCSYMYTFTFTFTLITCNMLSAPQNMSRFHTYCSSTIKHNGSFLPNRRNLFIPRASSFLVTSSLVSFVVAFLLWMWLDTSTVFPHFVGWFHFDFLFFAFLMLMDLGCLTSSSSTSSVRSSFSRVSCSWL